MNSEQKLRIFEKITKYSLDLICTLDRDLRFSYASDASQAILGYKSEELVGQYLTDFLLPKDCAVTNKAPQDSTWGDSLNSFGNTLIHKAGHQVHLQWSGAWSEEDKRYICVGRDVSKEVKARQRLHEKDELYRALLECGADMISMFDEEGSFLYSSGSIIERLGYAPEDRIGKSVFDYVHPDDQGRVKDAFSSILAGDVRASVSEFRFRAADGSWRWLETSLINQLHNPSVGALVSSSRNVTDRVENRKVLQEGEQRFRSLFENHSDAALYQDTQGVITDANPAALYLLGMQKQQVLSRPFSDFLPAQAIPVCERTLEEALLGKPVRFDITIPFEGADNMVFDIIKIPVKVDGETVGVYSILRDMTAAHNSRRTIEQQANKLETILGSITDAFFTLDREWRFSYVNSVFANHEGYRREELVGKDIWQVFPRLVDSEFHSECKMAFESGTTRHFTESYPHSGKTYRFNVYPSEEGLSVFFTDVTEMQRSRQELEKLSLVASKTTNGVFITSSDDRIEWVNEGFTKLTGYSLPEAIGKRPPELLLHQESDLTVLSSAREQMAQGKHVAFELLNRKKNGEGLWLSVDVNPIYDENGRVVRFVTVQTDITALKKSELSLAELANELYRQNRDLHQFTYIVSHNLRAPVANVMGLASMLGMTDKHSSMYDVAVRNLQESAAHLDTVVRDVNTILSVRDSKHTLEKEQVELAEVCRQACVGLQEQLSKCRGSVKVDIEAGLCVNAHKAYLHSIFFNLLSNAIKYRSEERPLQVHIKCHRSEEGGTIIIFKDNGSGFDVHKAGDGLFKLYQRFHTEKKGRGIGLYLVKTHVEAMEGSIQVDSQVNGGATFSIYLN